MGLDFIVLDSYHSEFKNIEMGQPVQRERELYELLAFIDEDGLLRVYGRLDAHITIQLKKTDNFAAKRCVHSFNYCSRPSKNMSSKY